MSKPSSATNSPQNFQRRRATTSQSIPRRRPNFYQQCLQVPLQDAEEERIDSQASVRPFSWHPSSVATQQQRPQSYCVAPSRNSLQDYPSFPASGIPTPLTHPELGLQLNSRPWYDTEDASSLYQQSSDYDVYGPNDLTINTSMQDGYFTNPYIQYSSSTNQSSEGYAVFSPMQYPTSAWTSTLSTLSTQTAPATPDFVAIEESRNQNDLPTLPRKESDELIGMGLYDVPDRHSWSLDSIMDGPTSLLATRPLSMGKGLKLEETWEPPEEEDSDSEEADEDDDDESQDSPSIEVEHQHVRVANHPTQFLQSAAEIPYAHMADQSFFFDGGTTFSSAQARMQGYGMMTR